MSDANQRIAGSEAPDAEVELSAQDLLDLSIPCDNNEIVSVEPSAAAPKERAAPAAAHRHVWFETIAALLILAVGTGGALYVVGSNYRTSRSAAQERAPQSQLPASVPNGEGQPVLFANPFDANEVFEFPAGTSNAEARDAVAEILMERALERQRQFDARLSNNS